MLVSLLFTIALASASAAAPINLARQVPAGAVLPTYPDGATPPTYPDGPVPPTPAANDGSVAPAAPAPPPSMPATGQSPEVDGSMSGPMNPANGGAPSGQSLEQPGTPATPAMQPAPDAVKNWEEMQQAIADMNNVIAEIIKANDGVKQNI